MLTTHEFLYELRRRGALRLGRVVFRKNRSTVWSLTQSGTVLNVHAAYRSASAQLLDAFAVLVREGGVGTARSLRAAALIQNWPDLAPALRDARERDHARDLAACCATPDQSRYLRALYRYFNRTRFAGALPIDVPVRLSSRMTSSLGHMLPGEEEGDTRTVRELALNVDLMLEGNGAERIDTLLHEMAHVADYLESGHRGHGRSWREWASRVGCRPARLYDRPVVARRRRHDPVTRVPPLPLAIWSLAD